MNQHVKQPAGPCNSTVLFFMYIAALRHQLNFARDAMTRCFDLMNRIRSHSWTPPGSTGNALSNLSEQHIVMLFHGTQQHPLYEGRTPLTDRYWLGQAQDFLGKLELWVNTVRLQRPAIEPNKRQFIRHRNQMTPYVSVINPFNIGIEEPIDWIPEQNICDYPRRIQTIKMYIECCIRERQRFVLLNECGEKLINFVTSQSTTSDS